MTGPVEFRTTQDRLNIFVSSRLQECSEERKVAHRAIASIQHRPVLFEHVGARPYSPRILYLSRLRDSQAMIAIYRTGYGWIDTTGGMTISGLEDELRFAQENGIDTLFYIYRSEAGREPRLQALIDEVGSASNTLYYYESPEELDLRIREDVTAFITDKVLDALAQKALVSAPDPLDRIITTGGPLLPRTDLLAQIDEQLALHHKLVLWGPAGIGKSTVAAQYAQRSGALFVSVARMSPHEIFAACAAALQGREDLPAFAALDAARLNFAAAWAERSSVALVVDDCAFVPELLDAIAQGGGTNSAKMVLLTRREPLHELQGLEMPDLSAEERKLLSGEGAVAEGNIRPVTPLEAQLAAALPGVTKPIVHLAALPGLAGEIVRTLALNGQALSAETFLALRIESDLGIEALQAAVDTLGTLISDTPAGFQLFHEELAARIVAELQRTPQRLRFYANPLIRHFAQTGNARQAYAIAELLGDGSERRFATAAAREASVAGDWKLASRLLNERLEQATDAEMRGEAFQLILTLIYPLELMGDAQRAAELVERAQLLAKEIGPDEAERLEEVALSSRARRTLAEADVTALGALHDRYRDAGRSWDQARLALEMSALYLAAKEPALAARYLRPAIQIFEEIGDEYGLDLAQRNLASALTAEGTSDVEADELIRTIAERSGEDGDARRQRAWLANILTRKYRTAGRLDDALETAREAIAIAAELGDENLRALNLINLGNVYRDREDADNALQAYLDASVAAQGCGRRDLEADASRLTAGILNDFESVSETSTRFERARFHATHAVGLLRDSVSYEGLARASVELADAEENLGNKERAASAYFDAACYFDKVPDDACYQHAIVRGASLAIGDHNALYLERMRNLLMRGTEGSEDTSEGDGFLELLPAIMRSAPRDTIARLLTLHLKELWQHLEEGTVGAVTDFALQAARAFALSCPPDQSFRVLYAGVVMAALLRNRASPFHQSQLADIVRSVDGIYVREDVDGSRDWTVVLDLAAPVTVSIVPLDAGSASNAACLALAMFMKGFEKDLQRELFGDASVVREVTFMIGTLDQMPDDIAESMRARFGIDGIFAKQACIVTRSTDPETVTPTFVVLRPDFLEQMDLTEGDNSSLPVLLGLSLVELTFQLLREEVSSEELMPKITKLVRQALG
ncbi:MAG: hypothetical protein COW16_06860 [Sphingomonadales bacterium CG12_big_fil_rev_8_21_14_0_65_65_10]|nr:MAG: hypothetical protein COW16_06860 [Sphingomonadales bacterium CG12_big_fil_rev_8_21_14_0_65_65_10]